MEMKVVFQVKRIVDLLCLIFSSLVFMVVLVNGNCYCFELNGVMICSGKVIGVFICILMFLLILNNNVWFSIFLWIINFIIFILFFIVVSYYMNWVDLLLHIDSGFDFKIWRIWSLEDKMKYAYTLDKAGYLSYLELLTIAKENYTMGEVRVNVLERIEVLNLLKDLNLQFVWLAISIIVMGFNLFVF